MNAVTASDLRLIEHNLTEAYAVLRQFPDQYNYAGLDFEPMQFDIRMQCKGVLLARHIHAPITHRTTEQVHRTFQCALIPFIENTRGKIIFLGNGMSDFPCDAALKYAIGDLDEPPVVHDLLSYPAVADTLHHLGSYLRSHGFEEPDGLKQRRQQVERLLVDAAKNNLVLVQCEIGRDTPPPSLQNASRIVNIVGPSPCTLKEQMAMLNHGGQLFISHCHFSEERLPDHYDAEPQSGYFPTFIINKPMHK